MRIFGLILIIFGVLLMIGTVAAIMYLGALGCGMNATGCHSSMGEIVVDLLPALLAPSGDVFWVFWLPELIGLGLIFAARALRGRYPR